MTIEKYCAEMSTVKQQFNQMLDEMREDFLRNFVYKNIVSPGDKITDESGLPFVVKTVLVSETITTGIAVEMLGYRVLKSGHISKRGFIRMVSLFSLAGECWKNPIVKVQND